MTWPAGRVMTRRMRGARLAIAFVLLAAAGCYAPRVDLQRTYHPSDADLSVTRIVHGSVILDFRGTRILVDPWYSPTAPLGPGESIGIAPDKLPPIRGILITHEHSDHFDTNALKSFRDKTARVVVPTGLAREVTALGYDDVVEMAHGERTEIGGVVVSSVPAKHRVSENGYVLQGSGITAYLAGDTAFSPRIFWSVVEAFPRIDVALLPIGGFRMFGRRLDMTGDEAARAVGILRPKRVIPYHYALIGPFPTVIGPSEPVAEFYDAIRERHPELEPSIVLLQPGESWHYYP